MRIVDSITKLIKNSKTTMIEISDENTGNVQARVWYNDNNFSIDRYFRDCLSGSYNLDLVYVADYLKRKVNFNHIVELWHDDHTETIEL